MSGLVMNVPDVASKMTSQPTLDELAEQIKKAHAVVLDHARDVVRHAIFAGELLNRAKARVGHGEFTSWREKNCELPKRTAERYQRLADKRQMIEEELKTKSATVADMTLRQAERLITNQSPKQPKPTKQSAKVPEVKIIGGNDPLTVVQTIEETLLKALKDLRRNNEAEAREAASNFVSQLKAIDLLPA
jgi:Protein of unknown function (DUF3102)